MSKKDLLIERIFCSKRSNNKSILKSEELPLAYYVYDLAWDKIHKSQNIFNGKIRKENPDSASSGDHDNYHSFDDDADSELDFNETVELAEENFERIVELFEKLRTVTGTFLKSFGRWSTKRRSNILSLGEIARKIEKDKFNSNIAKLVGGVVTVIGSVTLGLSFLTPLAVVSVPLTISGGVVSTVGGSVVAGTEVTKRVLLKMKLKKAKMLVMEDEESFKSIAPYFTQREELKKAIHSLIGYNLFKDIFEVLQKFQVEMKDTADDFEEGFEEALKRCIKKMCENCEIINSFGVVIAPVVMAFVIVICLLRKKNRIFIECILKTDRSMMEFLLIEEEPSLYRYRSNEVATSANLFPIFDTIIDSINVVLYAIDIYFRPESKHAIRIRSSALNLEKQFSMIESAYNEIKRLMLEDS